MLLPLAMKNNIYVAENAPGGRICYSTNWGKDEMENMTGIIFCQQRIQRK